MNILVAASQTLVGLFVDDGALAIAILMVVLFSGVLFNSDARYAACRWRCASIGCLAVLFANVMKAAQE